MQRMSFCEICKSELSLFTPEQDDVPATHQCLACGLIQVRLNGQHAARVWRDNYSKRDGAYHRERVLADFGSFDARYQHDSTLARIRMENLTRFVKDGMLMDVGASNGAFVDMAAGYGFDAIGIEPDPWVVAEAWERQVKGMRVCSFENYDSFGQKEMFDAITFIDSFEHLLEPHNVLMKARRLLKGSGVLMIEMPDADEPGFAEQGIGWRHFKPREHAYLYGKSHVLKLLELHYFDLIDSIVPYPDRRVYYARKDCDGPHTRHD